MFTGIITNPPLWILMIIVLIILYKTAFISIIVFEYQKALLYRNGKFKKYYSAGKHVFLRYASEIKKIDIRPKILILKGQEIPSSDGVAMKLSMIAQYEIADPLAAINNIESYEEAIYTTLQTSLREVVGDFKVDDLLDNRNSIGEKLIGIAAEKVAVFGIKLTSADIKDIVFPGELKKLFAQIVKAKKESLATLERARGETAALRHLANAAKMAEDNPALLQLRALQALTETSGNTIVLGIGSNGSIIPKVKEKT